MSTIFADFKYAFRILRKKPGFLAVAALVLGLGIGANTAMFSVVNAVLLRPLPFRDPDRLVHVWHVPPAKSFPGMTRVGPVGGEFPDRKGRHRGFGNPANYRLRFFDGNGADRPEAVMSAAVSQNF